MPTMTRACFPPLATSVIKPPLESPEAADGHRGESVAPAVLKLARNSGEATRQTGDKRVQPADPQRLLEEVPAPDPELDGEHPPGEVASADPDLVPEEIVDPPPAVARNGGEGMEDPKVRSVEDQEAARDDSIGKVELLESVGERLVHSADRLVHASPHGAAGGDEGAGLAGVL